MFGLGVARFAIDERLHLVELVHPDDSAGVLAVAAGLAPETRGPARVPQRPTRQVQDFVGVVAGQRHFGRADKVEVVAFHPIDLVGVGAQKTRTGHHLRAHQHRRDHRDEAVVDRQPQSQLQQTQLQQGAPPGQEVEPGAGHFGAALHVEEAQRLADFEMVLRVVDRRRLPDHVEDTVVVLPAGGHPVDDDVRDRHVGGRERRLGVGLSGFGGLDLLGQFLGAR